MVSSAALIRRGDQPFAFGSGECREVRTDKGTDDILVSHVSINFDRSGYQRDINTILPIDRLAELAREKVIGSVSTHHWTVMGSTDPEQMKDSADTIAAAMKMDGVDAVVLIPV